jgi:hypothetical protein
MCIHRPAKIEYAVGFAYLPRPVDDERHPAGPVFPRFKRPADFSLHTNVDDTAFSLE